MLVCIIDKPFFEYIFDPAKNTNVISKNQFRKALLPERKAYNMI